MAEFYFHVIEADCLDILADIQQLGRYSVLADRDYHSEVPDDIRALSPTQILAKLPNRRLFLAGPSVVAPIKLSNSGSSRFLVFQDRIPNLVSLSLGRMARVEGYSRLGLCSVDHARSYYTPDGHAIPPTQALRREYAEVVKSVRRRCKRVRIDHCLWVGRHALNLPDRSHVLVVDHGKLFDLDGFFVRSNLPAESASARQHEEQFGKRKRTQHGAPSNGGLAMRFGDSGVAERPPSVS